MSRKYRTREFEREDEDEESRRRSPPRKRVRRHSENLVEGSVMRATIRKVTTFGAFAVRNFLNFRFCDLYREVQGLSILDFVTLVITIQIVVRRRCLKD